MKSTNNLYNLMKEYEVTDSTVITKLDKEILREMKMLSLYSTDGIRSLLNDFKMMLERKGA
ncbi:MAG: hypothetical protein J6A59_01840 [Lachnospiraceae bacterium]|nr:hypothetical protein [Lachnospiraceae bacterium]